MADFTNRESIAVREGWWARQWRFAEVDKLFGRPAKTTRADFIPLARLVADPVLLLVNDQQPYKTLKEFVEYARKANPPLAYASGGNGSQHHLTMEMLKLRAGINFQNQLLTTLGRLPALVSRTIDCTIAIAFLAR